MTLNRIKTAVQPIAILCGLLCTASSACAAIDQTVQFSSATDQLTFNKFDPSIGTLTGVTITLEATAEASIPLSKLGAFKPILIGLSKIAAFQINMPIQFTGPDSVIYSAQCTVTVPKGSISNSGVINQSGSVYAAFNPINLDAFQGTGTYSLNLKNDGNPYIFSLIQLFTIAKSYVTINEESSISIHYDYNPSTLATPVPEPATYMAGIACLAVLGLKFGSKRFAE